MKHRKICRVSNDIRVHDLVAALELFEYEHFKRHNLFPVITCYSNTASGEVDGLLTSAFQNDETWFLFEADTSLPEQDRLIAVDKE